MTKVKYGLVACILDWGLLQKAATVEAEESRLVSAYETALAHLTAGNEEQAQSE